MTDRETMDRVSHTNPETGRPFGETVVFKRGQSVAADGGEAEGAEAADATDGTDRQTMEEVSHTPPRGDVEGANRTFERGTEGREDGV